MNKPDSVDLELWELPYRMSIGTTGANQMLRRMKMQTHLKDIHLKRGCVLGAMLERGPLVMCFPRLSGSSST